MRPHRYLLLLLLLVLCAPRLARAADDLTQIYPSYIERAILFWTNVARMDYAKMPTPLDEPDHSYPNWKPPTGGEGNCPPVMYNRILGTAARYHAQQMADLNFFAHEDVDGGSFGARIERFQYFGAAGENIAMGQTSAEEVVRGWMMSPGHRENILVCIYHAGMDWIEMGTGYAQPKDNPNGPRYWVQDFGGGMGDQQFLPALPVGIGYKKNNKEVFFGVSFYDPTNQAPKAIQVVYGEEVLPLTLASGEPHQGTYTITARPQPLSTPYYFQVLDQDDFPSYYPETGSLLIRVTFASADEVATRLAPPGAVALDPELVATEGEGEGAPGEGEGEGEGEAEGEDDDGGGSTPPRDRGGCALTAAPGPLGGEVLLLLACLVALGRRRK